MWDLIVHVLVPDHYLSFYTLDGVKNDPYHTRVRLFKTNDVVS